MSVINSQPSPFGHLTRERHIESMAKPLKWDDGPELLAGEASQGCTSDVSATGSDSTRLQRHPLQVVNTWGIKGYNCSTEAWMCYETAPSRTKCQGALGLPLVPPAYGGGQGGELGPSWHREAGPHPGLQLLAGAQELCITSKAERHGLVSSSQRSSYIIRGAAGERGLLLLATEECNNCCFHLCGPARPCHLCLQDEEGHVVLWFCRPFRLGLSCLRCCQMEMVAFTGDNQLIGTVRQRCGTFSHFLEVSDACGFATMKIYGSCIPRRCFSEQEFQVLSSTDSVVATIWKKWPGFKEERNMDHESFGVDLVAADLSTEERALLLAAAFLLNFMFFEVS
ncbi:phospholipid scramblase family member 5-like [Podarcis muralis]